MYSARGRYVLDETELDKFCHGRVESARLAALEGRGVGAGAAATMQGRFTSR